MRRTVLHALVATALVPAIAAAQPTGSEQGPVPHEKSEAAATALAVGLTTAGAALTYGAIRQDSSALAIAGVATVMLGPSGGHFYAGEYNRAVGTSLVRAGGLALVGLGLRAKHQYEATAGACMGPCPETTEGRGLMVLGVGVIAVVSVYDIYDAHRAARRVNESARSVTVAPTLLGSAGATVPGLVVGGSF